MSPLRSLILAVVLAQPLHAVPFPVSAPTLSTPSPFETQIASNGDGFLALHLVKTFYPSLWPNCGISCPKEGELFAALYDRDGKLLDPLLRPLHMRGAVGKISLVVRGSDYIVTNGSQRLVVREDGEIDGPVPASGRVIVSNGTRSIELSGGSLYVIDESFHRVETIPPLPFTDTVLGQARLSDGTMAILTIAQYKISALIFSPTGETRFFRPLGTGSIGSIVEGGDHFLAAWGHCDRCGSTDTNGPVFRSEMATISKDAKVGPTIRDSGYLLVRTGDEVHGFAAYTVRRMTLDGKLEMQRPTVERVVRLAASNGHRVLIEGFSTDDLPPQRVSGFMSFAAPVIAGTGIAAGTGLTQSPPSSFAVSAEGGEGIVAWTSMEGETPKVRYSRFRQGGFDLDGPGRVVYPQAGVAAVASSRTEHLIVTVPVAEDQLPIAHLVRRDGSATQVNWQPRSRQLVVGSDGENFLIITLAKTGTMTLFSATAISNGEVSTERTFSGVSGIARNLHLRWDGQRYLLTLTTNDEERWRWKAEHALRIDRTGRLLEELSKPCLEYPIATSVDCDASECVRMMNVGSSSQLRVEITHFRHDQPLASGLVRLYTRQLRGETPWTMLTQGGVVTILPQLGDVSAGVRIEGDSYDDPRVPDWLAESAERLFFRFLDDEFVLYSTFAPTSQRIPQLFVQRLEPSRERPVRR
jgi:hypothetical protein